MNLNDLQKSFSENILRGEALGVRTLVRAGDFDSARRLQIYRNNIKSTLAESLQAIFNVTEAIVGKEYFKFLAHKYIKEFPPVQGYIQGFGDQFPIFIKTVDELKEMKYLPDIALIDWACHSAYHAMSSPSVDINCLARFSPDEYENLLFHQHPSVTYLSSEYPVMDIWNFASAESEEAKTPDVSASGQCALVARKDMEIDVYHIEQELFILLEKSSMNYALGSIIPYIIDTAPDYNLEIGLHKLFAIGAISEVSVKSKQLL